MNKQWMVLVAIASLVSPSGLMAQKGGDNTLASPQTELQATPEKVPFAAGAMSWLAPGLGSFYAGNTGHGVRHLGIAVGTYGIVVATQGDCNFFGESGPGCGIAVISALMFIGNAVWSIFTAVDDAKEYNRSLQTAGLRIAPELVTVESGGGTTLGLQLVRFGF